LVHVDDRPYNNNSNLVQLKVVDCKELEIRCLEMVKYMEEAQRIRLVDKQKIGNVEALLDNWCRPRICGGGG
jgi:hypothetical protein